MTFLNPLVLFGLAAAALPILIHLFNLRKLRTIEFSTLSFLKELQRTKIRRLKIRQLLLLVLRTLLIIFVVLAFSRPTLRGSLAAGFGSQAKTTAVFLVDNSLSMTGSDQHGELLHQAKDAALEAVELLKEGDEVFLLPLSTVHPPLGTDLAGPTRNFEVLKSAIRDIASSPIHRTLEDGLRQAARLLSTSTNFNKEIYVFSDFQTGGLTSETGAASATESLFPRNVRLYVVRLRKNSFQNLGILSLAFPNTIVEPGRALSVEARIGNYSERNMKNHVVSIFLDGVRVAQRGIDIESGQSAEVGFQIVPDKPGHHQGFVEIEDDDLQFDNRRYFSLQIPGQVRVLLIGNQNDQRYTRLALETRQSDQTSVLQLKQVQEDQFSAADVTGADVIVLSTSGALSRAQVDRIGNFLRAGGGLIIVPASRVDPATFNQNIATPLRLPTITGIDGQEIPISQSADAPFFGFDYSEIRHPLFKGMFEELPPPSRRDSKFSPAPVALESPKIFRSVRYSTMTECIPIIVLSNRSPFLVERTSGEGRVLLFSVVINLGWSDFPLRGLFVPLLHRSVQYVSQEDRNSGTEIAGNPYLIRARTPSSDQWIVENPESMKIALTPQRSGSESLAPFPDTDVVGIYTVRSGDRILRTFAVNVDPRESDTFPAEESRMNAMLSRLGIVASAVTEVKQMQEMPRLVLQSRFGVELWRYFLIAALILALGEMVIARDGRRALPGEQIGHSSSEGV